MLNFYTDFQQELKRLKDFCLMTANKRFYTQKCILNKKYFLRQELHKKKRNLIENSDQIT